MAFVIRDLSVLAYANGFTLWHYKAADEALAGVASPGYFGDAGDMMAGGDMIMVSGANGCRILCIALTDKGEVLSAPVG